MVERPALPGAVGASHLRVYDGGGTPHLHTVCTEAYYVIAGSGSVQTLTRAGGFEEAALDPGAVVWFTPGTIHRLVNGGDLEILVLMQNAGLPEAGDMVITFEPDVLADPAAYAAAATLPDGERTTRGTGEPARLRRQRALAGFARLRDAAVAGDLAPLDAFHGAAARLVAPDLARWREVWAEGPAAEVDRTATFLAGLEAGDALHLGEASVHRLDPTGDERRMGCCGTLGTYVP
jgi:mannose-6-phosphate isomerase-like protein (cupin superfamily)